MLMRSHPTIYALTTSFNGLPQIQNEPSHGAVVSRVRKTAAAVGYTLTIAPLKTEPVEHTSERQIVALHPPVEILHLPVEILSWRARDLMFRPDG